MKEKKRAIIIAIIVLLLILLTSFLIVNLRKDSKGNENNVITPSTDDESNKPDEDNSSTEGEGGKNNSISKVDNSYDKALEAVIKAEESLKQEDVDKALELIKKVTKGKDTKELINRVETLQSLLDISLLVKELVDKTDNASKIEDIKEARSFRNDKEVVKKVEDIISILTNELLKIEASKLKEELDRIALVLDDKAAPTIEGAKDKDILQSAKIKVNEEEAYIVLNDKEVTLKDIELIDTEGVYTLTVRDKAYNESTVTFIIDRTAATADIKLNNGNYTNEDVVVTISTNEEVETLEGWDKVDAKTFTKTFTSNGSEEISLIDLAKNEAKILVKVENIDKDNPVIELYKTDDTKITEGFYSFDIKALIDDVNIDSIKLNDEDYTSSDVIVTENAYTLVATDKAGNTTTVEFTIDKTSPDIKKVVNDKYYNKNVIPEITDANLDVTTLNDAAYELNTEISEDGIYTLVATDKAGNSTTVEFTIDKTSPTLDGVANKGYYKEATPIISDANIERVTINGKTFTSGTKLDENGIYILIATDKAGNTTTATFIIDTVAPKVLLLDSLTVVSGNIIPIKPVIIDLYLDTVTITRNGTDINYINGDTLTESGEYVITATDKAGNTSTTKFNMDSDRPILIEPINGGVYKEVEVKVLEKNPNEDAIVVLKKTKDIDTGLGIEIPIYEKIDYKYGDTINEEGEYIVVLADAAYNISYAKFTVDRSKPTFNIDNNGIYKEVTLEVYDTATTVTVISKESLPNIYIPTLKQPGNLITEEGKYQAVSTDIAGNVSTVYFTIDRSNPEITNIVDGVAYNKITPAIEDANKVTATLNGEEYVIGTEIATNGTYTLVATDVAGNTATANFVISNNIITIDPIATFNKTSVTPNITSHYELASIKLNNTDYTLNTPITADGSYTLVVTDIYGSSKTANFIIDTTKPVINRPAIESKVGAVAGTLPVITTVDEINIEDKNLSPEVYHNDVPLGELSEVNISKANLGTYKLVYNVTDQAGNDADEVIVEFEVVNKDNVIVFTNANSIHYYDKNTVVTPNVVIKDTETGITITPADGEINFVITDEEGNPTTMKEVGTYTVQASSTVYDVLPVTATYIIAQREVSLVYNHINENKLTNKYSYEYDGNTNPYTAKLVDASTSEVLETLAITYNGEKSMPNVGTYTMDVTYDTKNYVITNVETTEQTFEITKAYLNVTFPIELTIGNTLEDVKNLVNVVNGNGINVKDSVDITLTKKGRILYTNVESVDSAGYYKILVNVNGILENNCLINNSDKVLGQEIYITKTSDAIVVQ